MRYIFVKVEHYDEVAKSLSDLNVIAEKPATEELKQLISSPVYIETHNKGSEIININGTKYRALEREFDIDRESIIIYLIKANFSKRS